MSDAIAPWAGSVVALLAAGVFADVMLHAIAPWAGYLLAFLAGVLVTLQVGIVKNARQIRRNSETLRRIVELRAVVAPRVPPG